MRPFILALVLAFVVFGSLYTTAEACENIYPSGSTVPTGYAPPWNQFTSAKELLVRVTTCTGSTATVEVGSTATAYTQYTYNSGYYWDGTQWRAYSLTGTTVATGWLSRGTGVVPLTTGQGYVVGYTCQLVGTDWKCGCRNTSCTQPAWQLQGYKVATASTGGTTGGTTNTATWKDANLTWYTSYPDPGSEECIAYNGCTWAGQFAALSGKQPESWVKANNIAAVHEKFFNQYKLKTLRLTSGSNQIDVKVYDMCADSDCNGCCTRNLGSAGFLIDIEKYTADRFGVRSGTVKWTCLDC